MVAVVYPKHSAELTPELVTRALSEWQPGVRVEQLRVVEEAHCETGSASTAARAVLDLEFAPGCAAGVPDRIVLKTILVRRGAPDSLYRNEVRFYRELRRDLDLETPAVFAASFDPASGTFGVMLEDVRRRGAVFPDATRAMNLAQMRSALSQLARLHARFWQSPRFGADLDWLWTPRSGEFHDFLRTAGFAFIAGLIRKSDYKRGLFDRLGRSFEAVWEDLWRAQEMLASEPTTLLHGDTHFGNTYLLPGDRVGLLDWQLLSRGRWCHDVTYLLVTALDTATRRKHQRELLAHYLEELRAGGVAAVPDLAAAWSSVRRSAIWGFVLGWLICPVENYGDDILEANLERLVAALEDFETFDALASDAAAGRFPAR